MKTLFMFPGQGAQQVGMGKTLADKHPQIADLYQQAGDVVGCDLADLCFNGPEEKLNSTEFSQPAIFTTSAAALLALRYGLLANEVEGAGSASDRVPLADITPDACVGLSLGEYTALYAADAMTFADALTLVQLRGQSMQAAADDSHGTMISILGLDSDAVQKLCDSTLADLPDTEILIPVNFNCPGQIVLSGTINACNRAAEKAESFGASRAVPLNVAGAFHSPMMIPAADKLRHALDRTTFSPPTCPVLANVDALPYDSTDQIPDKLMRQLTSPVLFQQTIEKLLDDGFERFVEIGPGRILTGLLKKTARPLKRKPNIITLNA